MNADLWVGVDGCKSGWLSIQIDSNGEFAIGVDANISAVWHRWRESNSRLLIDIPIGLPHDTRREVDLVARTLLQGNRKSSVFPTPCRAAAYADDYETARSQNRRWIGVGISTQTWAICSKIREVDSFLHLQPEARMHIREIHPEILFWALNGSRGCIHRKSRRIGIEERLQILQRHYQRTHEVFGVARSRFPRTQVANDDIVDALAAAVCGWKARGKFELLGGNRDASGITMEMVYWRPAEASQDAANALKVSLTAAEALIDSGFD